MLRGPVRGPWRCGSHGPEDPAPRPTRYPGPRSGLTPSFASLPPARNLGLAGGTVRSATATNRTSARGAWPPCWEQHRNKAIAAAALGLPILALYGVREPATLAHTAGDYVSFIVLLAGLYVISGGIRVRGDLVAPPATNTAFLASGALIASFIGTTGASMLLIRALLQTN